MPESAHTATRRLSVIIPCYNEAQTLGRCVERLIGIADVTLALQIVVVDDCSTDDSHRIAQELAARHPQITLLRHERNQGKGAALRTGFKAATAEIVVIQDADLEYDPRDLKRLIAPIHEGIADVVLGTRFALSGAHRVLYFWHYLGNRFLTLLSNMFTDLNLTDMECGYKVFRREVIDAIRVQESRFGIEPELVAKVAQMRLRIYEMGVSYAGRTYEEGKKIGVRDGFQALYCILRYNAFRAPAPLQFLVYFGIAAAAAAVETVVFHGLGLLGVGEEAAIPCAYALSALLDYLLCIGLLFRHRARWGAAGEIALYALVALLGAGLDFGLAGALLQKGYAPWAAKAIAWAALLLPDFIGRKYVVFFEPEATSRRSRKRR